MTVRLPLAERGATLRVVQGILTRGICRSERVQQRWSFAGWATGDASENGVRPRAYYRSCHGCRSVVLTLADVDDAMSFCRAVLADWRRRAGVSAERVDTENVLGDLYAWLWYLYTEQWRPGFGKGDGTFTGYASEILRRKIHRFVALDVGDRTEDGRNPKAHSRFLADSYEGVVESAPVELEFAVGSVALDPTGDLGAERAWLDALGAGAGGGHPGFGAD